MPALLNSFYPFKQTAHDNHRSSIKASFRFQLLPPAQTGEMWHQWWHLHNIRLQTCVRIIHYGITYIKDLRILSNPPPNIPWTTYCAPSYITSTIPQRRTNVARKACVKDVRQLPTVADHVDIEQQTVFVTPSNSRFDASLKERIKLLMFKASVKDVRQLLTVVIHVMNTPFVFGISTYISSYN